MRTQVLQVRGFAEQRLRYPKGPLEASNRRISIMVEYVSRESTDDASEAAEGGEQSKGAAKKEEAAAKEGAEHATLKSE